MADPPVLSASQHAALQLIVGGQNVFVAGAAGSGKSTLIGRAKEELGILRRKFLTIAPTGAAAYLVGGTTIHSLLAPMFTYHDLKQFTTGIEPWLSGQVAHDGSSNVTHEKRRMRYLTFKSIHTIFIDEISMCQPELLYMLHRVAQVTGRCASSLTPCSYSLRVTGHPPQPSSLWWRPAGAGGRPRAAPARGSAGPHHQELQGAQIFL